MKKKILTFTTMLKKLDKKKKGYLYNHFDKYIVDYKIEGNNIRVYSNVGKSRVIKNSRPNQVKLNQVIIKNKIDIANKIDEYEDTSKERLLILIMNIFFLIISGLLVLLTFFIGSYLLFIISIFIFALSSITISIIMLNCYILLSEIKNLKNITGYKKEIEFKLPRININQIKTR